MLVVCAAVQRGDGRATQLGVCSEAARRGVSAARLLSSGDSFALHRFTATRRRREVIAPCVWEQLAAAALALLRCQPALVLTGALRIPVLRSSSAVYECPGGLDCRLLQLAEQRLPASTRGANSSIYRSALQCCSEARLPSTARGNCHVLPSPCVSVQATALHSTAQTPPQRETRCSSVTNSQEPPPPPPSQP